MANESAVPVTAYPATRLRRYSVELLTDEDAWRVLGTVEAEGSRAALDAFLRGRAMPVLDGGDLYRVTEESAYGITQRYVVRPSYEVFDYEWPEEGASSGGGEPS